MRRARQEYVELSGIFGREHLATTCGVSSMHSGVHAGNRSSPPARNACKAQRNWSVWLASWRHRSREGAARERQRDVECFRLGAGRVGNRDHVIGMRRAAAMVARVHDRRRRRDDHVELFLVPDSLSCLIPAGIDSTGPFAIERGDGRDRRQRTVRRRRSRGPADEALRPKRRLSRRPSEAMNTTASIISKAEHGAGRRDDGGGQRQQRDDRKGCEIRAPARRRGGKHRAISSSRSAARAATALRR